MPAAVGMAYSVTVTAAALAMPVLYGHLTQGADPVEALHAARQALHDDPARQAYFDQQLDLQDWVLRSGSPNSRCRCGYGRWKRRSRLSFTPGRPIPATSR